jgi:hypothetical protein
MTTEILQDEVNQSQEKIQSVIQEVHKKVI